MRAQNNEGTKGTIRIVEPVRGGADLAPSTHQRARYALTSRVGRDTELADLKARAAAPNGQVLTLTGPVGVGKSRLADALFEQIAGEFADGGRYLELDTLRLETGDLGRPDLRRSHAREIQDQPSVDSARGRNRRRW